MAGSLGLDALLKALRTAGLRVGYTEIARLQHVFAHYYSLDKGTDPQQTARQLRSVLRAVLVKNTEQNALFDKVYRAWLTQAEQAHTALLVPAPAESRPISPTETTTGQEQPEPGHRRYKIGAGAAVLVLLFIIVIIWQWPKQPVNPNGTTTSNGTEEVTVLAANDLRQREFQSWQPIILKDQIIPAQPYWTGWPFLVLGGLALAVLGGLWQALGRRAWLALPDPAPAPGKGPARAFLQVAQLREPELLDARQQESVVWGIGRFVSEELTRRLDLTATVQATAQQGGIPALRFEHAHYQREVWLWLDEAADDRVIARLAEEIENILKAYGLRVERAGFRGVPERLFTAEGAVFAPREIDERRELALVAILTDGRLLSRQYPRSARRVQIDAVLRDLSYWPQLAFFDFTANRHGLAVITARHDLLCLKPQQLAAFLGGDRLQKPSAPVLQDLTPWAAACALAPTAVDEATALLLRRALHLKGDAWGLSRLQAEAPGPAGRLLWPPSRRAEYLNWLLYAEANTQTESGDDGISAGSLLDRALAFWERRYDEELADRASQHDIQPWLGTPAEQQMRLERELLRLWRDPATASERLYSFYRGQWQAIIGQQLSQMAPRDWGQDALIHLPWNWNSQQLKAEHQVLLQTMGLGGAMPAVRLARPGRLWLGLGACGGLAAAMLLAAMRSPDIPPAGPPVLQHSAERPVAVDEFIEALPEPGSEQAWRVTVTTPKWLAEIDTSPEATVPVKWQREPQPCIEQLGAAAELWRCGSAAIPAQLSERINRSVFVLQAPVNDPAVEGLAAALLAGGSADLVLIAEQWPRYLETLIGRRGALGPSHQLLVIAPTGPGSTPNIPPGQRVAWVQVADWSALYGALLRFSGEPRALSTVWPQAQISPASLGDTLLGGIGGCQPQEEIDDNGFTFIRLCPGTFTMGDDKSDQSYEKPAHPVTIASFSIMATEVTNAQYRLLRKDHEGADEQPAISINWNEAKAFCEDLGYRLPSEAEWEYAARAGSQTQYAFGDDVSELERYAWYDKNSKGEAQAVATREPNAWGLYDMHGNVWEWVQDCWHDNYEGAPSDGSAWEDAKCGLRVLRGGAFSNPAVILRSAFRSWGLPERWGRDYGFRCARGPRRQL